MLVKFMLRNDDGVWIESTKVEKISKAPSGYVHIDTPSTCTAVDEPIEEVVGKINAANSKHFITLTDPAYTDMTYQIDADEVAYVGTVPSGLFEGGANIYTKSCGFFKASETADKVMDMVQKATAGEKENT